MYDVAPLLLAELDAHEGHPRWYQRMLVDVVLDDGTGLQAWLYSFPVARAARAQRRLRRRPVIPQTPISQGIPHGGWCPKGRRAEGGGIPDRYLLRETASPRLSGGTLLTYESG